MNFKKLLVGIPFLMTIMIVLFVAFIYFREYVLVNMQDVSLRVVDKI